MKSYSLCEFRNKHNLIYQSYADEINLLNLNFVKISNFIFYNLIKQVRISIRPKDVSKTTINLIFGWNLFFLVASFINILFKESPYQFQKNSKY